MSRQSITKGNSYDALSESKSHEVDMFSRTDLPQPRQLMGWL